MATRIMHIQAIRNAGKISLNKEGDISRCQQLKRMENKNGPQITQITWINSDFCALKSVKIRVIRR
jgi:hypothetical protein